MHPGASVLTTTVYRSSNRLRMMVARKRKGTLLMIPFPDSGTKAVPDGHLFDPSITHHPTKHPHPPGESAFLSLAIFRGTTRPETKVSSRMWSCEQASLELKADFLPSRSRPINESPERAILPLPIPPGAAKTPAAYACRIVASLAVQPPLFVQVRA